MPAATKLQYEFVPVFAVMVETGTKCFILTQVLDLVSSLYWYSEGAVSPTVCFTEKVFFRRYGATAVPFTLAETPLSVIVLFAYMEAKS